MAALGKGLASLIPRRGPQHAKEAIERIDSMEFEEESKEQDTVSSDTMKTKTVHVVEEFEDLEPKEDEVLERPVKPLTTPLEFDPDVDPKEVEALQETIKQTKRAKGEENVTRPRRPVRSEGSEVPTEEEAEGVMWDKHEEKVENILIGDIHLNPLQPRRHFDAQEMEDLKESIEHHGILQPLVVRRMKDRFELIAGERRLRAAKELGWDRVPCVVRRGISSDESRLELALIENIQRENLNPVEQALAYKRLNEEFGLSHEEVGRRVGKSRVGVTNTIRVLQLPAEIQRGLSEGKIAYGHAKAILMIPDEEKQIRFYHHLLDEGLTVQKAEIRARRIQRSMKLNDPMRRKTRGRHELALKYGPALEDRYGYAANVRFHDTTNRFEVIFKAVSIAEVEELIGRLLGTAPLPEGVDEDVIEDE